MVKASEVIIAARGLSKAARILATLPLVNMSMAISFKITEIEIKKLSASTQKTIPNLL